MIHLPMLSWICSSVVYSIFYPFWTHINILYFHQHIQFGQENYLYYSDVRIWRAGHLINASFSIHYLRTFEPGLSQGQKNAYIICLSFSKLLQRHSYKTSPDILLKGCSSTLHTIMSHGIPNTATWLFLQQPGQTNNQTSNLCITGLCEWNPQVNGGFPSKGPVMWKGVSCHHLFMRHGSTLLSQ